MPSRTSAACERLGPGPAVLRDYVKSMKHYQGTQPHADRSFAMLAEIRLTAVAKVSAVDLTTEPGRVWLLSR